MAADPNLLRRVARLENETESIYELITEIRSTQREHTRRFDTLEATFGARLQETEARFDKRFDGIEATFGTRFEGIEATLGEVLRRLPQPS